MSLISRLKAVVAGDEYLDDDFDEYDYESEESERMIRLLDSATPGQWKQVINK